MTAEEPLKTAPSAETLHNSSSQDDMNSPKTPPEPDGDTSSDEARKRQAEVEVGEPKEKVKDGGEEKQAAPVTESSRRSSSDGNSCPKRVTQVVCNILRCKTAVEADDSALRPVSRQGRQQSD
ncbi:hypothetical protein Cni_G28159 [Canna indica]|uniref:Uncharacterized protein n=1 Tax=Canna indica TaxID=4628 RepID=A0AAQ3L700_9LILI|nr:hypothetical protein Cni_G28159 [Canna indica]